MTDYIQYDKISAEVNAAVNRATVEKQVELANNVFMRDWLYMPARQRVRMDGVDYTYHTATREFFELYRQATQTEIVQMYNILKGTNYILDPQLMVVKQVTETVAV